MVFFKKLLCGFFGAACVTLIGTQILFADSKVTAHVRYERGGVQSSRIVISGEDALDIFTSMESEGPVELSSFTENVAKGDMGNRDLIRYVQIKRAGNLECNRVQVREASASEYSQKGSIGQTTLRSTAPIEDSTVCVIEVTH